MTQREKPRRPGLLSEYVYFLRTYKMWWLLPLLALLLGVGALVVASGTQAGLLIYALF